MILEWKKTRKSLVCDKKAVSLHRQKRNGWFCWKFGLWCNGNTTDSGPVFPGSSPGSPTDFWVKLSRGRVFYHDFFFLFVEYVWIWWCIKRGWSFRYILFIAIVLLFFYWFIDGCNLLGDKFQIRFQLFYFAFHLCNQVVAFLRRTTKETKVVFVSLDFVFHILECANQLFAFAINVCFFAEVRFEVA